MQYPLLKYPLLKVYTHSQFSHSGTEAGLATAFLGELDRPNSGLVDSVVDGVLEVIESGFRFFQLEELANRVENMQNGNLLARIFGMEAEGTIEAPSVEDTEPEVAEAPVLRTDPHFRM